MRQPAFCICEIKDPDQLCGNHAADECLCFRYIDIIIPLLPKAWFVSVLVGNPDDWFSHDAA